MPDNDNVSPDEISGATMCALELNALVRRTLVRLYVTHLRAGVPLAARSRNKANTSTVANDTAPLPDMLARLDTATLDDFHSLADDHDADAPCSV